jgi:hypothetical protein
MTNCFKTNLMVTALQYITDVDNYFDDYDFEDRPVVAESPRLTEFDTATYAISKQSSDLLVRLSNITPPAIALPPAKVERAPATRVAQTSNLRYQPQQNQMTQQKPGEPSVTAAISNPLPNATTAQLQVTEQRLSSDAPNQVFADKPHVQGQPLPMSETPMFSRITKDGALATPYNPRSGNFSPVTRAAGPVDFSKSTPILRSRVQKVPLGNNINAQNTMGESTPISIQSHRLVGCPSKVPANRGGLYGQMNSVQPAGGVKRNLQGQFRGFTSNR